MKRFAVSLAGFLYGLVLTWACLVLLSHFEWFRDPNKIVHGCNELGMCPFAWYNWIIVSLYIFGPATLAAATNAYAWKRWSLRRWVCVSASTMLSCAAFYFIGAIVFE